ncbi:MAG: twin-arginine translocation signal domain-containing protein [Aeromicrobium sp.]|jgi:formate dehydrogenase major subunit|nr:twin-arginine translocation signal domain-containing protein [Aeromicrobium sp.]
MATKDKSQGGKFELSRRDFLKVGATAAAAGAVGLDFAVCPSRADAAEVAATYHTTCPYCSASCGQLIDVDADGNVLDIYGDHMSPFNDGGLCAKGAGTYQLVTNKRRLGVSTNTFAENGVADFTGSSGGDAVGVAWKRTGDGAWAPMGLQTAMAEIAERLVDARGTVDASNGYNSKSVAFFGSSHLNNEPNYVYRRLIAQFGTTNVEHQARI